MKQFKPIGFVKMKKTFVFLLAFPNIDPIFQFSEMSCQFSLHNFLPLVLAFRRCTLERISWLEAFTGMSRKTIKEV